MIYTHTKKWASKSRNVNLEGAQCQLYCNEYLAVTSLWRWSILTLYMKTHIHIILVNINQISHWTINQEHYKTKRSKSNNLQWHYKDQGSEDTWQCQKHPISVHKSIIKSTDALSNSAMLPGLQSLQFSVFFVVVLIIRPLPLTAFAKSSLISTTWWVRNH